MPSNLSSNCQDLIKCMLELDTSKRITALAALKHPWILASEQIERRKTIHDKEKEEAQQK